MKKMLTALLAAVLLLAMGGCGAEEAPAPADSPTVTAEPVPESSPEPAEEPAPAPLRITGEAECMEMLVTLGYREANLSVYGERLEKNMGISGASVTPVAMEVTDDGFAMELTAMEYFHFAQELRQTDGWMLYGTKGDALSVFVGLEEQGYTLIDTFMLTDSTSDIYHAADYTYYLLNEEGKVEAMAFVTATYYPGSGNLYNVVQTFYDEPEEYGTATILAETMEQYLGIGEVETLQWGDYTIELHPFIIQCGNRSYAYQYRPGMSLSDWACSELNTDGWIPWYDDMVLSPDRQYRISSGYLAMDTIMAVNQEDFLNIYAEPFDGELDHTYLYSFEVLEEGNEEALAYLKSEESEIATNGNINVPVAHMVNAKTPLMSPGFRMVGREEGRAAYHSVEMGQGLFLLDDIIDIYMNGIADELIPHIKLYAFPESEEFMATLEGQLILNAHPTPFEAGHPILTIPEDAVCLTFERVPDRQEAPGSPNPRKPGHENLNKDAVFARYVTKDDPHFGEGVNLVFAITFDDELVYWIHMGSNFHEKNDVTWYVNAMGY